MTATPLVVVMAVAALAAVPRGATAQETRSDTGGLRDRLEQRFEVLPIREGLVLLPREAGRSVRSIEVTSGPIAVDGQPATGAELRERLGASDADLVLAVSYLSEADRRALFVGRAAGDAVAGQMDERRTVTRRSRDRERRGSRPDVRFGGNISVDRDEIVEGDVVAIGGSIQVDGEVRGDVVAVGGSVTLGPTASVQDNVVVVGGSLTRDPGAHVGGRVSEVRTPVFDPTRMRERWNPMRFWGSTFGSVLALFGTITRVAILCLLASLVVLFGQGYMERAASYAASQPLKAGAIGLLAQILFVPVLLIVIIMLVVTIIGIPLLVLIPFLLIGLVVVGLVGFSGVAFHAGRWLARRMGWSTANPYVTTISGVVLLLSPIILARLVGTAIPVVPVSFALGLAGAIVEYLAWTIGFGSVALVRFGQSPLVAPPTAAGPQEPTGDMAPA
jgi:hypothetical protein